MNRIHHIFATVAMLVGPASTVSADDESHLNLLRQAEASAAEFRSLPAGDEAKEQLKKQVQSLVEKSFDARQIAQREQIEQMRQKLREAEQSLDEREDIRDRIISRKVEDLLSDQSAEWQSEASPRDTFFDVIGIGDVITIYLAGVLPFNPPNAPPTPPATHLLQSGRLVSGYPLSVGSDGAVSLPLVSPVNVAGLTVREAEKKIASAYIEQEILRPEKAMPMITLIPKEEMPFNVVDEPDATTVATLPSATTRTTTTTAVPSFEDTYGRLNNARELAKKVRSGLANIKMWRERIAEETSKVRRSNSDRVLADVERQVESARFKLQLEKDYIADVIEQLQTDLVAKKQLLEESDSNLKQTQQLFQTGVTSVTALGEARSQFTQQESEYTKAKQKFDQYAKISKRWNEIVGDALAKEPDSKERVDERSDR